MARLAAFAFLALCLVVSVSAATKSYLTAYKSESSVDKYQKFADQVCAIADAASAGSFDKAKSLYDVQKTTSGYADTLKAFATSDFKSQRYNGLAQKYWGQSGWLDEYMMAALTGTGVFAGKDRDAQGEAIEKSAQSNIAVQLILKELDTAADNMAAKNYDNSKGAPHALDEGWAVYSFRPTCGPYDLGNRYANQFGTITDCTYNTSTANTKIVNGFVAARAAAKKGDQTAFTQASDSIVQGLLEFHIQAVLNYAKKMSDPSSTKAKIQQAEGYTFWRTIAPFVDEQDKSAAATINSVMSLSSPINSTSYTKVKDAFESVYAGLKVNTGNIGSWKDSPAVTCPATSGAVTAKALALALFAGLAIAMAAALL